MKLYETVNAENWQKGYPWDEGRMCLQGRLLMAGHFDFDAVLDVCDVLFPGRSHETDGFMIPSRFVHLFNDHPDTTLEDVIRVLKVADV